MSNIFHWFYLFRSVACCGYLTSNQRSFNLHNTHQKVIAKLYSFTLRNKITDKKE